MKASVLPIGALLWLAACAAPPNVPAALRPNGQPTLALTTAARGVQVYQCRTGAWAFVAPEAELLDVRGHVVGTHGAGPFWQLVDGSRVTGSVQQRADAPVAGAIPWLLLAGKSESSTGMLAGVSQIQRVNTRGGAAPAGACADEQRLLRVPYTADYHFYRN